MLRTDFLAIIENCRLRLALGGLEARAQATLREAKREAGQPDPSLFHILSEMRRAKKSAARRGFISAIGSLASPCRVGNCLAAIEVLVDDSGLKTGGGVEGGADVVGVAGGVEL